MISYPLPLETETFVAMDNGQWNPRGLVQTKHHEVNVFEPPPPGPQRKDSSIQAKNKLYCESTTLPQNPPKIMHQSFSARTAQIFMYKRCVFPLIQGAIVHLLLFCAGPSSFPTFFDFNIKDMRIRYLVALLAPLVVLLVEVLFLSTSVFLPPPFFSRS